MKQKHWLFRAVMAFVLVLSVVLASPNAFGTQVMAAQKSAEQQLADLKKEEKRLQDNLDKLERDKKDTEEYLDSLKDKISVMHKQLDVLNGKINKLDAQISVVQKQIDSLEEQIQQKQRELDGQYQAFSERMETIYRTGSPSKIEAFLTASDFSDFLMQAEMISNVTEEDKQIMDSMKKQMNEIKKTQADLQNKKSTLDQQKKELESSKKEQETKRKQVQKQVDEADKLMKALDEKTNSGRGLLSMNLNDQQDILDKINNNHYTDGDGNVTGNMMWPMPGYSYITTYFNTISGYNGRNHGGIDIAGGGINGKKILAADGGTVIAAEWHYSYGYYVMIDHHNGLVTLYAHSQKLLVREGQAVTKGQAIALVGSTGESSGPHLHFEVRKNGTRVNPFNYVHY